MFTYLLEKRSGLSLYEQLVNRIREDILSGKLPKGEKLPSKRQTAQDLGISIMTVQCAYEQLEAEGYISAQERRGYFVEDVAGESGLSEPRKRTARPADAPAVQDKPLIDLTSSNVPSALFPMSVWTKLSRRVYLEQGEGLLRKVPYNGLKELRSALAEHLYQTKGMQVSLEQIIVTSGNEHVYMMLGSFFGDRMIYGVETPGYGAISNIYSLHNAPVAHLPMDDKGVRVDTIRQNGVNVLHVSPAHHFPTGIAMPAGRRQELLNWSAEAEDRYIIEDDFDSEFRMSGRPIPPLALYDTAGKVIYINTFTKTISPALRMGYAVLPPALAQAYKEKMGFLASPVPAAEQYILASFIGEGCFDRHLHRMRAYYKKIRDHLIRELADGGEKFRISNAESGLHFLLKLETASSGDGIMAKLREHQIKARSLQSYQTGERARDDSAGKTLVVSYAGLTHEKIPDLVRVLKEI